MARQARIADEPTIIAIYKVLGLEVPRDRAIRRVTIVLDPMKQILLTEEVLPVFEVADAPKAEPAPDKAPIPLPQKDNKKG